jgi:hypothetical protein
VHFYIVLQKIKHRNVTFFHYTKEARRESAGGPEKEIKHIYAEPMRATLETGTMRAAMKAGKRPRHRA